MSLAFSGPNFLAVGETFADETTSTTFLISLAPTPNTMLLAAVMGPSPAISGPAGVTWLPCGNVGRLACFYAVADGLTIPSGDDAWRVTVTGRSFAGLYVTDVDSSIGPLVSFATDQGTLLPGATPSVLVDVSNGQTVYDTYYKAAVSGVYHGPPGAGLPLGVYGTPSFGNIFGIPTGFSSDHTEAHSFPTYEFPLPDIDPGLKERDEFVIGSISLEGCGDFTTGFEVGPDTTPTQGTCYLWTAYFVRPGAGTCGGGGGGGSTGGDKAVANLESPFGLFFRAWISSGNVLVGRAEQVTSPFSSQVTADPGPGAVHPDLYLAGQRLYLLYGLGNNALRRYSDDDGATWSESEVAFTGGAYPRAAVDPVLDTVVEFAYVGGTIKARRRGPGDADFGTEYAVSGLGAIANAPFGVSWAYDPQSRVVLSVNTGSQVVDYESFDDGETFAAV